MKQTRELTVTNVSEDDRYLYSDNVQVEAGIYSDARVTFFVNVEKAPLPYDVIKVTIEYDNDD